MKSLKKIMMLGIVAGLSLTATGLFAADQESKQKGRRGGKMPEFLQDLSKEDRAQLKELMQAMRKEMDAVKKSDAENKMEKMKAIAESYAPKIKAIVGEDNFTKMQEARQKRMGNRSGKGGKGGKGGMLQGLNLTEEQKTKLKALHEEMQKEREAARVKFEAKIKEIVGEENFKKMQEARKSRGGQRGEGRMGGRGPRGPRGPRHESSDTE